MIIRKISEHSIAKSVLASLTANQNPWFRRKSSGIFVVAITVEITISSGTAAARVQSPTSHENATRDFECTDEVRREIRMRESDPCKANHSHFGSVYFRMPCVKKINPTARRIRKMPAGPRVGLKKNRITESIQGFIPSREIREGIPHPGRRDQY